MEEYPFREKSDSIVRNLEDRSKDLEEVSRQINRAREVLKRYQSTGRRPPSKVVFKQVYQGKRGGLYYKTANNKRVYLTPGQCKKCLDGRYPVRVNTPDDKHTNRALGCPPVRPEKTKCKKSRNDLKREIRRLRKIIEEDC